MAPDHLPTPPHCHLTTRHRRRTSRFSTRPSPLTALLLAASCCLLLSPGPDSPARSILPRVGVALLPLVLLPVAHASPQVPWDSFTSPCKPLSDPPTGGFKLWSDASTWPNRVVPGVGAAKRANATIPCGTAVLLNVPSVVLSFLTIRGMLKIEDTPLRPVVAVNASFVIVEGQLLAGSSKKQFSQKAVFTLTPNANGRAEYHYTAHLPADPDNPRNFGHKAFVVVGGAVHLHGMPGGSSTPAWCRLAASARAGDLAILVDGNVTAWPVGYYVGLAPTDFYADQVDVAAIVSVTPVAKGKWRITLDKPLSFNHFGEAIPDGFGGTVDERGEVVLLNRSIVIQGEDEPEPYHLEGGHFMVFFTRTAQFLEGVEFALMGQQGNLGRYNIHFHLCGDQMGKSVVRKNVMHDSKQRCVVVHATFNLTVEENVAFNTRGHCFLVEEGGEQGNNFIRNVGIWTRPVEVLISDEETDDKPSTFWISNANNNYIGNVAAGAEDTGFWLELRDRVRGISLAWPKINTIIPINFHKVGTFAGNVAHSCGSGFRDYPRGFFPRYNATTLDTDGSYWNNPAPVTIAGFLLYKNLIVGALVHLTDYVILDGFTAADNVWGVLLHQLEGAVVRNLRVVGQSTNYGNPYDCTNSNSGRCAPISGCNFPLAEGQQGRSVGWGGRREPVFGLVWTQSPFFTGGIFSNVVDGAKFAGFNGMCRTAAAVAVADEKATYWNAGNNFKNLKFSTLVRTDPFFLSPRISPDRFDHSQTEDHGPAATQVALRDMDGSIVGAYLGKTSVGKATLSAPAAAAASSAVASTRPIAVSASLGKLARRYLATTSPAAAAAATTTAAAANAAGDGTTGDMSAAAAAAVAALKKSGGIYTFRPSGYYPSKYASSARSSSFSASPLKASASKAPPLSGFLVANNTALLPPITPAGSYGSCKPIPGANAFACPSPTHCFRTVNVRYLEPATAANMGAPQPPGALSSLRVVRLSDGAEQVFEGNVDRIDVHDGTAERVFGFTALTTEVYVVEVVGPDAASDWHPQSMRVHFGDGLDEEYGGNCGGAVAVRFGPVLEAESMVQWAVKPTDDVAWRPCPGTTQPAPILFSYECDAATQQQQLQVVLTGNVNVYNPAVVAPSAHAHLSCSTLTQCGLLAPRTVWRYNQEGGELHPRYPLGPAYYNPLFPDSSWPSGPAPLAYVGWDWYMVGTFLSEQSDTLATYYFRSSFALFNSACVTHLAFDYVLNDGVIVYVNNQEVLRTNMPDGDVSNATKPSSDIDTTNSNGFIYQQQTVEVPAAPAAPVLRDGVNVVAVEVHASRGDGWDVAWSLRLSALATKGQCSGPRKSAEVCDGVDNDYDGKVDNLPGTKGQRPCATACGVGVEKCIKGAFQGCTAPKPKPELCNGKDDNCDGLIDNGPGQLDCKAGSVCFQGQCLPLSPLTAPAAVIPSFAPGWRYYNKGRNMNSVSADWTKGDIVKAQWSIGAAPFGFFPDSPALPFATKLPPWNPTPPLSATRYFLHSFSLTDAEASSTYAFECNLRRVDGAVIYINGQELDRSNMPDGDVTFSTRAVADSSSLNPDDGNNAIKYYHTDPHIWTGRFAQSGVNWVAVELHEAEGASSRAFDLNVTRHAILPCPPVKTPAKTCIRNPPTDTGIIWGWSDDWAYLDATSGLPPSNWFKPTYSDTAWSRGPAPLGNEGWDTRTTITTGAAQGNGRRSYYFRKSFSLPDAKCFFRLKLSVLGHDGMVVYINGAEAGRANMPLGPITATTPARTEGPWDYTYYELSGGFLKTGRNLIAVEVHEALDTSTNYFFDLELLGQREAVNCLPLP